jgi:hypothetical protein
MTCVLDSCNQGREPCPDPAVCCGRARRQEAEYLWTRRDLEQCAASGQMDSRQIAAHIRAGELDGIGVEAADAPRVTGAVPPIVTTELRQVDWTTRQSIALVAAYVLVLVGAAAAVHWW